ncbi:MAG: DNA-binding protein [Gammaproteobacteria bacterium]|nr:DNA-binding protein [Gammaproteobacteria bacterium]MDH5803408.1 DNA-binding protein [Gammaproteobacteria bacterium]
MARLLVRDLDPEIAKALKKQAAKHGRSAEAEHREILKQALLGPKKKSFAQVLLSMPNVGQDSDFERVDDSESDSVFN